MGAWYDAIMVIHWVGCYRIPEGCADEARPVVDLLSQAVRDLARCKALLTVAVLPYAPEDRLLPGFPAEHIAMICHGSEAVPIEGVRLAMAAVDHFLASRGWGSHPINTYEARVVLARAAIHADLAPGRIAACLVGAVSADDGAVGRL